MPRLRAGGSLQKPLSKQLKGVSMGNDHPQLSGKAAHRAEIKDLDQLPRERKYPILIYERGWHVVRFDLLFDLNALRFDRNCDASAEIECRIRRQCNFGLRRATGFPVGRLDRGDTVTVQFSTHLHAEPACNPV